MADLLYNTDEMRNIATTFESHMKTYVETMDQVSNLVKDLSNGEWQGKAHKDIVGAFQEVVDAYSGIDMDLKLFANAIRNYADLMDEEESKWKKKIEAIG